MSYFDFEFFLFFLFILILSSYFLGKYIYYVFQADFLFKNSLFGKIENTIFRFCKIDPKENMSWKKYSLVLVFFNVFLFFITFIILKSQENLPLNFLQAKNMSTELAVNTAISFVTNTNWQAYSAETEVSYLTQMLGLTPLNFLSAATGIAACVAILRGFTQFQLKGIGNFWYDLFKTVFYILLPISFIFAVFYISQGVIQNFLPPQEFITLEGIKQIIPQGPAASQVAITLLGTNGGGFFNANMAHPYLNPNALTNFVQILSIILIPSSLVFTFGKMSKNMKHAWTIWITMFIFFAVLTFIFNFLERSGNPLLFNSIPNLNWEGKETRFGLFGSTLFSIVTTITSCGAVNSALSSLSPLAGGIALFNMLLGEIIFGGVGSGLYGMLLLIVITIFLSGLMIGRTPEYLGKKIDAKIIRIATIPIVGISIVLLISVSISLTSEVAKSAIGNPGVHGFTEIFYAITSTIQNNGSSFGSLNANTTYWNYLTSILMLIGRYLSVIPVLAIAGILIQSKKKENNLNPFPIVGGIFIILLSATILIVGALTYLPAFALGPVLEHLQIISHSNLIHGVK
ncbi:potassium-transporting ATPase subunit KdpA [Pigmentibacter ruber]|nr:potassium-transporting ATPase subunit KdpA [Pigmentibacter ruber]